MRVPIKLSFTPPTLEELGEFYDVSKARQAELLEIIKQHQARIGAGSNGSAVTPTPVKSNIDASAGATADQVH